jgi:transcription elongation factor GreA
MTVKNYETKAGEKILNRLMSELKEKSVKVIEEIAYAKSFGDLSENAEYKAAKENQRNISQELLNLQEYRNNLVVIDNTENKTGQVSIGATVRILNLDNDEEKVYKIVGMREADASIGLIFYQSPIARALMGKSIDNEIEFTNNQGQNFYYKILDVKYLRDSENE